jgi:hypothetical protein
MMESQRCDRHMTRMGSLRFDRHVNMMESLRCDRHVTNWRRQGMYGEVRCCKQPIKFMPA